jgi:hypothetical protein
MMVTATTITTEIAIAAPAAKVRVRPRECGAAPGSVALSDDGFRATELAGDVRVVALAEYASLDGVPLFVRKLGQGERCVVAGRQPAYRIENALVENQRRHAEALASRGVDPATPVALAEDVPGDPEQPLVSSPFRGVERSDRLERRCERLGGEVGRKRRAGPWRGRRTGAAAARNAGRRQRTAQLRSALRSAERPHRSWLADPSP